MLNNRITVIDVSFWQDDDNTPYKIDFNIMKSQGIDGVIIRAGQNVWEDEDYQDYVNNAVRIGFPRGAYWYYDSRVSPIPQADIFADIIDKTGFPQLGIWGDFEEKYGGAWGGAVNFRIFMNRLVERFPEKYTQGLIGVYTAPSYWRENVSQSIAPAFKDFPLWIAHYYVGTPVIPFPWDNYVFWQYTDKGNGKLYGAESNQIDMNVFDGTLDEYKTRFNIPTYVPGEPQQGEEGMYKVWSETNVMTLRETNEVSGIKITPVPLNVVMSADRLEPQISGGLPGDLWAHGTITINGVPYTGWMAITHNGITYCKYELIPSTGDTLPVLNVTLEAVGYPTMVVEWKPNA